MADVHETKSNYYMGLEAFSVWLQEVAAVQEVVLMTGNPNADKSKWTSKDKLKELYFLNFRWRQFGQKDWSRLSNERW